jgi:hypothetical protein
LSSTSALSWSVTISCSWRAIEPSARKQYGTGGGPSSASASSSRRCLKLRPIAAIALPIMLRAGILGHHARKAGAHLRHQGGELILRLLAEDAADHEQAVARLVADDVGQGHHAHRRGCSSTGR